MSLQEELKGYKPEVIKDEGSGFEPFKAKGTCMINKAQVEYKSTSKYEGNIFK